MENMIGKIVDKMIGKEDLILLNIDDRCKGTCYTWERGEQKSARDLAKVNNKGYEKFGKMDEKREKKNTICLIVVW